jgi:uncharacterized membrane protein HdeD (DUF308 family)
MPGRDLPTPNRVSAREAYRIALSVLMIFLGGVILYRAAREAPSVSAFLVGFGMLALGVLRLRFVVQYFRRRKHR